MVRLSVTEAYAYALIKTYLKQLVLNMFFIIMMTNKKTSGIIHQLIMIEPIEYTEISKQFFTEVHSVLKSISVSIFQYWSSHYKKIHSKITFLKCIIKYYYIVLILRKVVVNI